MTNLIDKLELLAVEILYEAGERGDEATRLLKVAARILTALVEALRQAAH